MLIDRVRGMSHALRTPLGVVLMSAGYLQSQKNPGCDVEVVAQVEKDVLTLVDRLKIWSARAIEQENAPDLTAFSDWVKNEVSTFGDQVRALLEKAKPLEGVVPPLKQARDGILNLIVAFERIHGVEKSSPTTLDPKVFAEQLRFGVLHAHKRETLPLIAIEIKNPQPIPTEYWLKAWTWMQELEAKEPESLDWKLDIDAPVGLSLRLSEQAHTLNWK